ncbi:hypothetical protein LSAT2_010858 [Lamellibrachia satsuma]|nr:hypothetical protein LSAT2_010858 [Lamellibrachia satsuma]
MGEVNPQTVLEVFGLCETYSTYSNLHFNWTLTNAENESLVRTVRTVGFSSNMLISTGTLTPGNSYTITLSISLDGEHISGVNKKTITVTSPPYGGHCYINPHSGNAFHKFYVNCSGWKNGVDVEPKLLFDYAYQLRDVITPLSTNTSTLPPGDCNNNYTIKFIVYIRNKFGATAEQQLIVIVVAENKSSIFETAKGLASVNLTDTDDKLSVVLADYQAAASILASRMKAAASTLASDMKVGSTHLGGGLNPRVRHEGRFDTPRRRPQPSRQTRSPGKVFCKMILMRIDDNIDKHISKQHFGLIKKRGTVDVIFMVRQIMEKRNELQVPLH